MAVVRGRYLVPRAEAADALIGRVTERALVDHVIQHTLAGDPQLLVIEGDAGVGKTALARAAAAAFPDHGDVVWSSGEVSEQSFDFGVIDQLVREASAVGLPTRPPFSRTAVRPDPLDVGQVLLDLVDTHGHARPSMIVVDDAQWADVASLGALSFAFRRLRRCSMMLAIVHRPDTERLESFHRLVRDGRGVRLRLDPLTVGGVAELVHQRTGLSLTPAAAERLHAHTTGNPLEAITLIDELDEQQLTSGFGPVPAPRSFASLVIGRLAGCAPAAEQLVAAVAVAGQGVPLSTLQQAGLAGRGQLREAVDRHLLVRHQRAGRELVDVAHPLVRSTITADLSPSRLGELHRLAATLVDDPMKATVHRLRGIEGEDPARAEEAVEQAHEQAAAGWCLSAVELLTVAAGLFPAGPRRHSTRLRAAELLVMAGDHAAARTIVEDLVTTDDPQESLVRAQLAILDRDLEGAWRRLDSVWAHDPGADVAARVAAMQATVLTLQGQVPDAAAWARKSLELGCELESGTGYACSMLAGTFAVTGELAAGERELAWWHDRLRAQPDIADARCARGALALWSGRLDDAQSWYRSTIDSGRGAAYLTVSGAKYGLADALYRRGRWDEALEIIDDLCRTVEAPGLLSAPMAHSVAAFVRAGRGELDVARGHLKAAARAARAVTNGSAFLWMTVAQARVAQAAGDPAAVVAALEPFAEALADVRLPEDVQPFRADLVEAYVTLGRLDDAATALAALDVRLAGGAHARVGAQRVRAILAAARGDDEAAEQAFAAGLDGDEAAAGTFVWARLLLAAGAFARRRGQRRVAADHLDAAIGRLAALGAEPWLRQAEQERAACGLSPRRGGHATAGLTKAEIAVAELVAAGHTNREVANRLVVSPRTVETHLARAFMKLGVRSRTELANAWRERSAEA